MDKAIAFAAEIREVKSRKLITNDIEYTIKFNTIDQIVLDLAKIPADQLVKVIVELENGQS